ncbi:MAG: radical SAM/SPASM domain-containing protein [Candidatus Aramenus sp.]|nr:radical SAM/SPASM domain-containing protein [Candidatus Aramenus sp.]
MLWLVMTTGKCNLVCDYCGGSFPKDVVPWKIGYSIEKLKKLIESDPEATVVFYGGEPLNNPKFIMDFIDRVRAKRIGIQTNGTLVKLLPQKYWKKINVALMSIDGRPEITDKHRGKGIYKVVTENTRLLKSLGVETIARMTVTEDTDIYEDVAHLLSLGIFDKVHWQLNVVWTERWNVEKWAKESYLPGIKKLVELFVDNVQRGKVVKIIPILGVISAHYFESYRGSPCGAGYKSVTVTPEGRILSCPIAVREKWAELGTLDGFKLLEDPLPDECKRCEFKRYCGGRCLYASKEKFWGEEGFKVVDQITKEYLRIVLSSIPEIEHAIKKGAIRLSDLNYDPTMDSTEVIP